MKLLITVFPFTLNVSVYPYTEERLKYFLEIRKRDQTVYPVYMAESNDGESFKVKRLWPSDSTDAPLDDLTQ